MAAKIGFAYRVDRVGQADALRTARRIARNCRAKLFDVSAQGPDMIACFENKAHRVCSCC
jgi:hypothetical protein